MDTDIVNGETTAGIHNTCKQQLFTVDMCKLKSTAAYAIDAAASKLNDLSQELWKHPELSFCEFRAHATLTDFLETEGFTVERSYHLKTAFRATFAVNKDVATPNIAVLCEYDALPDIGHACGHNLIAEVGVGASLGIKAAMEECGLKLGQVTVVGCPAEEDGGGKIALVKAGAFEDVDAAMMSHPSNFSAVHSHFVACQELRVIYRGVASHAAVEPWNGVNALDAAVMAYNAISCMRQQMQPKYRVHGIITKGGHAPNIIPSEAELFYNIRAPTDLELDHLVNKCKACFEAAAVASGCKVELVCDSNRYKDMITNEALADAYQLNALHLGVDFDKVSPDNAGSTDMGNVSYVVPSIHPLFYFGSKYPEHSSKFAEHAGSSAAQMSTIREAKILAFTAIDILYNQQLFEKMKNNFSHKI